MKIRILYLMIYSSNYFADSANEILTELLKSSIKEYRYLGLLTIYQLVRNHGPHDLKNNMSTIYGLANDNTTRFSFRDRQMSSQDIGNFHYGVATKSNVIVWESLALWMAGWAQRRSGNSNKELIRGIFGIPLYPPYGDDPIDQYWIREGFKY